MTRQQDDQPSPDSSGASPAAADETEAARVVAARHAALNGGDVRALVRLSDPPVQVGGPRGTGSGTRLLPEWVERAKVRLEPRRIVPRGEAVVVEQEATWEDADDDDPPEVVASVFVVRNGRVASVVRYDDLQTALWALAGGDAPGSEGIEGAPTG